MASGSREVSDFPGDAVKVLLGRFDGERRHALAVGPRVEHPAPADPGLAPVVLEADGHLEAWPRWSITQISASRTSWIWLVVRHDVGLVGHQHRGDADREDQAEVLVRSPVSILIATKFTGRLLPYARIPSKVRSCTSRSAASKPGRASTVKSSVSGGWP